MSALCMAIGVPIGTMLLEDVRPQPLKVGVGILLIVYSAWMAFVRRPGATPASAQIAQAKARTAALMRRETLGVEQMINQGRTAFLSVPGLDGLLEGGVPVLVEGHCVGAVGVSGVKSAEDAQIARAGIAALLQQG